jgi:hypothetical protein
VLATRQALADLDLSPCCRGDVVAREPSLMFVRTKSNELISLVDIARLRDRAPRRRTHGRRRVARQRPASRAGERLFDRRIGAIFRSGAGEPMTKKNDWQTRFGLRRRQIDRAILAECERTIAPPSEEETARAAIARAFGRPVLANIKKLQAGR